MRKLVKSFLLFWPVLPIFFLTGCGTGRYHDRVAESSPRGPDRTFSDGLNFIWPVEGKLVSRFGSSEEGVALKGVVLEGFEGQEVRSAERGQVVFVDAGMRGYGKTVIVEHSGGYSTVYARNSQLLVRTGDKVQKGQPIARVGRDGKGDSPRVYFELRQHSKPLDPQQTLK